MIADQDLKKIVAEEIRRVLGSEAPAESPKAAPAPAPMAAAREAFAAGLSRPANSALVERLRGATPAALGVGRTGTRYLTPTYLKLRAEHAIAKDAVYSEASDELIAKLGCLPIRSQAKDRQDYLLYPERGRRLDDASRALLARDGTRGADVQVILADGLSAWAAEVNGPQLLPLLTDELRRAGWSVGKPLFARFARVGLQDDVGVLLGAKATLICLGERPGLGTGDSMSVYIAYGPKLDQDNAEKNCISNVRPLGIHPPEAAKESVEILKRAFAAGRGGVTK